MALPSANHVAAVTQEVINDSIADTFFSANPLAEHLIGKGSISQKGGDYIALPIFTDDTNAAGSYDGYDLLDTGANENVNRAEYDWRHKYVHVSIARTELLRNSGESQIVDLVKGKVKNAMMTIRDLIGTDFFSTNGDSSTGFNGLRQIVKATGAIGGVNQSDLSVWASDVDASTQTLTLATMEQAYLDGSVGGESPDIIVTRKGVFQKYWSLLQANQRFGEGKTAKGGFRYLLFNEVPVFWDTHCPGTDAGNTDNHMFFLNSKWLYFYVHKDDNFKTTEIPVIANQDVFMQRITISGQLCTDNRRMHSLMSTLNH